MKRPPAFRRPKRRAAGAAARVQSAVSAVEGARGTSDAAAATEALTRISAPFDGVITEKMAEPGNMASPGLPLLRIEDTHGFRLDVRVDESQVRHVTTGATVPVLLDTGTTAGAVTFNGTVAEVGRAVDSDARSFIVKIALPTTDGLRSRHVRARPLCRSRASRPDRARRRARQAWTGDHGVRRRQGAWHDCGW